MVQAHVDLFDNLLDQSEYQHLRERDVLSVPPGHQLTMLHNTASSEYGWNPEDTGSW
jgi:hypothetical protein